MTPAYDLRTNAKTKGNRPFLPPNYMPVMHVWYLAVSVSILVYVGYLGWGAYLRWHMQEMKTQETTLKSQLDVQDQMLWLADWRSNSVPMQALLVEFFSDLPREVSLSQLIVEHNSAEGTVDLRVAINSDKSTSAQYFREMQSFLLTKGLSIQTIEQNMAVGATVFQAKFRIMRKFDRGTAITAPAATPAPKGK